MPIYVSDDIVLKDNKISTAQSNANVLIEPNGSGALQIDGVNISGNTITTNSSNANLELTANSSGYVSVLGTGAFRSPVGTTAQRPTGVAGFIRLNTTTGNFEGYDGSAWGSLAGSSDAESDTSNTTKVTLGQVGTTATIVDSFGVGDFQTVKYNYVVNDEVNGEFQSGFIHLVHDSTTSYMSEYAITDTGGTQFATFTTDISGSTVRLKMSGTSTTNSVTLFRTGLGDNSEADSSSTNTGLTINTDVDSAQESLDTTDASTYRGVQYFILASQTTGDGSTVGHECIKINVVHDGTTAYHSAFGRTSTTDADLMTYDVDINSGNIRLLGTGATANTTVKIYKIQIKDSEEAATGDNVSIIVNTDVDSAIENVDTFENSVDAGTTYQAAHYFNTVKAPAGVGGAEYQVSELVVVGDGGDNVYESEFGIVHSGNRQLITYSTDFNNTTARLRGVGATTNLVVNGYRVNMERKNLGVSAASVMLTSSDQTVSGVKTFTSGIDVNDITASSNADINVSPSGTGSIKLNAGTDITGATTITLDSTSDALLLTSTEASSTAAPVMTFKRNSSSPADADYLGQIKFKGENDADQEVVYAKITAKILDASDGSEDGIIEFAHKKAGSNVITGRFRSDSLQLLNDTSLRVTGHAEFQVLSGDPSTTTNMAQIYAKDDASSAEMFVQDEAGNVTKISPHNEQGDWEYYSRNIKTGKVVRINMEEMVRDIEKLTGKTYIKFQ